ncbi:MAG: cytidine deaminase [Alphaproteobacteria bacterium]|nr:cytidine deaminase [Alphaproteobacteria bacterium]
MKKEEISDADHALVAAAVAAVKKPVLHPFGEKSPALVGAAARLDDGGIVTAVNLIADVGGLSICAEPIAIAEAARLPDRKITEIVAVYHVPGEEPKVVSPCGRCREAITDYAPGCSVILRTPGKSDLFKASAADILPLKYAEFWQGGRFI